VSYKKEQPKTYEAGEFVGEDVGSVVVQMFVPHNETEEQLVVGQYFERGGAFDFKFVALEKVHGEIVARGLKLIPAEGVVIPPLPTAALPLPVAKTTIPVVSQPVSIDLTPAERAIVLARVAEVKANIARETISASWKQAASRVIGKQDAAKVSPLWARTVARARGEHNT